MKLQYKALHIKFKMEMEDKEYEIKFEVASK
jgi:hypothetical protein